MTDNIRHSSATAEHYTPLEVVEPARLTLGRFDLDPASCHAANELVRASGFYTKEDNGYLQDWEGNVFLNPPGGWADKYGQQVIKASKAKGKEHGPCTETGDCGLPAPHTHEGVDASQKLWWQKLVHEWGFGKVSSAIFVCFSIELLQSTQVDRVGPLPLEFPICFPSRRIRYVREDGVVGASPPHASAIVCVSADIDVINRFQHAFFTLGHIITP